MFQIDINCDMGESFGVYRVGIDERIMEFVTSANIACGYHGGDPSTMRKTVIRALEKGVSIGAHPGFPDLMGFGRRNIDLSPQEAYDIVVYQIGALYGFVKAEGAVLRHVKPHGALYNMAAEDVQLAEAIAEAVYNVNPELILFGLSGSELITAGKKIGLQTANEVFADRTYQRDGSLTPRKSANALIIDDKQAVIQALRMVQEGKVLSVQGEDVAIKADTICIHGDGQHAIVFAQTIRNALQTAGVCVQAL